MIIYKVTNLLNGKIYIGQSIKDDPNYFGSGVLIKNAIEKYGKQNFIKELIDTANSVDELNEKEIYWISEYNSTDKKIGYNLCSGGKGFKIYYGKSDEQINEIHENLSKIHKEKWNNMFLNMNDEDFKKLSESRSEISKKSWNISGEEYKDKCKRISEGLKNSDYDFKSQLKNYWDSLGKEEINKINQKRNLSNSKFWKNMTDDEYKKRCDNISIGKSHINQSEVSSEFWKNMSIEKREHHSKKISLIREEYFKKIKELEDKEDISDIDRQILMKEENRKRKISEESKATFEVINIITGEVLIIVSVDKLCKLIGVSEFMYKYNLSKKNYIINNYQFKKLKKNETHFKY